MKVTEKEFHSINADTIKLRLVVACNTRLSHYAGVAYQRAVHAYLSSDFGVAVDDTNKSHLANAVQSLVIQQLSVGIKPRY